MSGRGGAGRNHRGRRGGGNGGRGRNRGRGKNYSGSTISAKKPGLCAALGSYIFDYGHKGSADQMRTSWEKLVQYVGTNYEPDISSVVLSQTMDLLELEGSSDVQ